VLHNAVVTWKALQTVPVVSSFAPKDIHLMAP